MPEQAGPAPVRGPGHPLALGRDARARLGGAARALLDAPGLKGATDAVRLSVLVLAARTSAVSGRVEIRTGELGRWLGMSASYVASEVLPRLRRSGVVEVTTAKGEFGTDRGLDCRVLPLWEARGIAGHPLALHRKEYATWLRLLEALMAPGWAHRDGTVTPAGLLAERRGRGAATDRLALLLLALEATDTGRVRQCGGTIDTKRGRAAATLARLLGCTVSAGERVLERLEDRGLVQRVRLRTESGLAHRTRLMVPAVATAHGRVATDDGRGDHAAVPCPVFSEPDAAAGAIEAAGPGTEPQVGGAPVACEADAAEPDVPAALHTDHPPVVTPVSSPQLSGGFSGEDRGGNPGLPDRPCVREDQAANGEATAARSVPSVAEQGPLRGEKPIKPPVDERDGQRAAGAETDARPQAMDGGKAQQRRRAGLPADPRLRVALRPVAGLWERLSRWQQDQVEAVAKAELHRLAGLSAQPETAPRLLADRLTDRLRETGGEALVTGPYGWLVRRGLVQRPACSDRRCDDGIRLDTGGECDNCGNVIHLRRARRVRIAAEIDQELLGLADGERRQVLEARLREQTAIEAGDFVWRREQAAAEQARRDTARAAAEERAELEREAAAAADAVRQALPCEDCGQERAAGLCEACGYRRRTETLTVEAGLVAATWSAALDDADDDVAAVAAHVRTSLEGDITTARAEFLELMEPGALDADPVAAVSALAFAALQAVEQAAPAYRRNALAMLGRTEEAEAEAKRAYATEQNRRWFRANPNGADAVAAATKAAYAARERTAQHLLATRLAQLREQAAARTLDSDICGPVIA
ncbi:hypothetical protein AB0G73_32080 [Streptomyces sp. NPDC020719]|uniref:hypothetical protein n=1 Tax=Streptomyces sp. NPDC020719 TaxID=3154896 RepID=UPI0033DF25E9